MEMRRNVGYMTQAFSLYGELTVRQNLELHAQLYHLPSDKMEGRIKELLTRYDLEAVVNAKPESLPLGIKQRLQLAVAVLHEPAILILDEPTSGRRSDRARCILAHADRSLPRRRRHDLSLDPFHERGGAVRPHLADACGQSAGGWRAVGSGQGAWQQLSGRYLRRLSRRRCRHRPLEEGGALPPPQCRADRSGTMRAPKRFDLARLWAYARRETVELLRDPIRLAFAVLRPHSF